MRHALETKIVKQVRAALLMTKGRGKTLQLIKDRYESEMEKMGVHGMDLYHAWNDLCDMAELENMAEAT